MPPTRNPGKSKRRDGLIRAVTTPLGFYVLALLIIEATLAIVLTSSKLDAQEVWRGFLWMIGTFIGVVVVVTALTILQPKNLLYGKEEHANPALDPGALRDAIEELIAKNVKAEALKPPER
ncbi:MAG TPA: hypothetical protein VEO95_09900, partial [Chthoniobacteraceae bacterium]|nr:hypothetical protein [Chthoniobacteraceae bacterium]